MKYSIDFKERARNKLDNWVRIYVRIQGAAKGIAGYVTLGATQKKEP